jgi:carbon storage regulator
MLVLSRKKHESVMIGDNVAVTVVEVRGDKVRLGIEAPKDVAVHRREIYDAIRASQVSEKSAPEPPGSDSSS